MNKPTYWNQRDYNVVCDICGKKRKRSECTAAYGAGDIPVLISCRDGCADYRHPLNSPPPVILDQQPVPDARPENIDLFRTNQTQSQWLWGSFPSDGSLWGNLNNSASQNGNNFSFNPTMNWGSFP